MLNTGQLDTVVLLVVVSQMMRGQAPQIFFLEPPLATPVLVLVLVIDRPVLVLVLVLVLDVYMYLPYRAFFRSRRVYIQYQDVSLSARDTPQ